MNFYVLILFLIGPLAFHLARVLYHYLIKYVLTDIFEGEVSFTPGYNFFSLSDIVIKSKNRTLKCKYFTISFSDHKYISFSDITTDFDIDVLFTKALTKFQSMNTRKNPFSSLFCYLLTVENFKLENENMKFFIDNVHLKLSTSKIDVMLKEVTFENHRYKAYSSDFKYTVDYFGDYPSSLYIMNPSATLEMKGHNLLLKSNEATAFSTSEPTWRLSMPSNEISVDFKNENLPLFADSVNNLVVKDNIIVTYENQICISIPVLDCLSTIGYRILFKNLKITKDGFQCEKTDITATQIPDSHSQDNLLDQNPDEVFQKLWFIQN